MTIEIPHGRVDDDQQPSRTQLACKVRKQRALQVGDADDQIPGTTGQRLDLQVNLMGCDRKPSGLSPILSQSQTLNCDIRRCDS